MCSASHTPARPSRAAQNPNTARRMMTATATTAIAGNGSPVVSPSSSPATPARSAYVPLSAPQIVPFLATMAKELDDLLGFTDFRPLNPLKQQHFRNSSALRAQEQGRVDALHLAGSEISGDGVGGETEDGEWRIGERDSEKEAQNLNGPSPIHGGDAEKRAKAAVHCRQLPDYNEEEAPDGFFLKDGRILWRPNWSNLRCAFFENLVSTAVKKCLQNDPFVQIKSKPTNNELRGRVVDYLNSVVREKKKAEVKKKTEARMKNVKGRTMRFRVWLISNWKDTPLDGCKERDLLKRALLSERGVLRNLHFLEHNEIEDVLKRVAERRSNSAGDNDDEDDDDVYDEFLLLADAYYGSKIRLVVWTGYESWLQAQDKAKRRLTPVFHLPYKYHHTIAMGFSLASSPTGLEETPDGLFHPTAEFTRGMIDWEAVQKMDSSFVPTYEDVPPDPTRSQSTQGRLPLLEILRHHHSSVYARLQKRLVLLPRLESYTLRSLWKSRCGEGTMQYESKLQRAIADESDPSGPKALLQKAKDAERLMRERDQHLKQKLESIYEAMNEGSTITPELMREIRELKSKIMENS
ncbi:hypothetical protein LQV05_003874 [Cryptococcus neoformans]|nr:hypothetical protein LQV05_003874 [Cryptococcus neoformans]